MVYTINNWVIQEQSYMVDGLGKWLSNEACVMWYKHGGYAAGTSYI